MTRLLQVLQNMEVSLKRIEAHLFPKIFCILNECCEILESDIEPILPILVSTLLAVVNSTVKIHYRELAISVIGQAGMRWLVVNGDDIECVTELMFRS